MRCPKCGEYLKGHVEGTEDFRDLSPEQQKAAIASATAKLNDMQRVYAEMKAARAQAPRT